VAILNGQMKIRQSDMLIFRAKYSLKSFVGEGLQDFGSSRFLL